MEASLSTIITNESSYGNIKIRTARELVPTSESELNARRIHNIMINRFTGPGKIGIQSIMLYLSTAE